MLTWYNSSVLNEEQIFYQFPCVLIYGYIDNDANS